MERNRKLYLINNLLSGLGIIILGIIFIVLSNKLYTGIINILVIIYIIYAFSQLVNFIISKKRKRNKETFIRISINLLFSIILLVFPNIPKSILPIFFSLYLFMNGTVKLVNFILFRNSNFSYSYIDCVLGIFYYLFALFFVRWSLTSINTLFIVFGVYSMFLGINRIVLFIQELIPNKSKLKIKRNLRMTLPLFFEAFIPISVLKKINKEIDFYLGEEKKNKSTNLEVIIHLSDYGFNQFGHTDICFDDLVYSYGNYDKTSRRIKTAIGDGVMFVVPREDYIKFCTTRGRKTLVSFGVELSEKKEEKLRNKISELMIDSYLWNKDVYYKKLKHKNKDYTSKLYYATKAKFYKFKTGKFKNYFVLGNNCTTFVDSLLGGSGINVLKPAGIISPGTYYEFLDNSYRYKNTKVVSKIVYNEEKNDKNKNK